MVLLRDGKNLKLAQCGLGYHQRFTFYDHIHTTGMDIKQPLACTACLTLGKDMTLRDYAQGAYRMRGIGQGQRIELFLPAEVAALISEALGRRVDLADSAQLIVDVTAWLCCNNIA